MAYVVTQALCKQASIATTLAALWNAATVGTHHGDGVVQLGSDRYLVYIVYE